MRRPAHRKLPDEVKRIFLNLCSLLIAPWLLADGGEAVVVVYNTRLPESKAVAEHYAKRRAVPANQLLGFALTTNEVISRAEFRDQLQLPLLQALEDRGLFTLKPDSLPAAEGKPAANIRRLTAAKIRYAVLCYGVPLKIAREASLEERGSDELLAGLRRNDAAVDSELSLLPLVGQHYSLTGFRRNPLYAATNSAQMHPTNGVLLVARLDGPTPQIARALVDKAIRAETEGWWGHAYFDARGLTEGAYKLGDDWIRSAAQLARRVGFETILDERPETFPVAFPLSQVALYLGWYDGTVSGPFTRPEVEFMPGAIAYHLHSFSAQTIRSSSQQWVGPLLAKGVTATMGCVEEPYLAFTPDIATFCNRIFSGWTFGESAYAAQSALSWQTTVVGDPLYRPLNRRPQEMHAELARQHSQLIEWSHLRVVNLSLAQGATTFDAAGYLEQLPETKTSAVLLEKLGDLFFAQGKPSSSAVMYERALKQQPSPQQKVRLLLTIAERLAAADQGMEAAEVYRRFLKEVPDYPDATGVKQKLTALEEKSKK